MLMYSNHENMIILGSHAFSHSWSIYRLQWGASQKCFSYFYTWYVKVGVYLDVCKVSWIRIRCFFVKMYIDFIWERPQIWERLLRWIKDDYLFVMSWIWHFFSNFKITFSKITIYSSFWNNTKCQFKYFTPQKSNFEKIFHLIIETLEMCDYTVYSGDLKFERKRIRASGNTLPKECTPTGLTL